MEPGSAVSRSGVCSGPVYSEFRGTANRGCRRCEELSARCAYEYCPPYPYNLGQRHHATTRQALTCSSGGVAADLQRLGSSAWLVEGQAVGLGGIDNDDQHLHGCQRPHTLDCSRGVANKKAPSSNITTTSGNHFQFPDDILKSIQHGVHRARVRACQDPRQ